MCVQWLVLVTKTTHKDGAWREAGNQQAGVCHNWGLWQQKFDSDSDLEFRKTVVLMCEVDQWRNYKTKCTLICRRRPDWSGQLL